MMKLLLFILLGIGIAAAASFSGGLTKEAALFQFLAGGCLFLLFFPPVLFLPLIGRPYGVWIMIGSLVYFFGLLGLCGWFIVNRKKIFKKKFPETHVEKAK